MSEAGAIEKGGKAGRDRPEWGGGEKRRQGGAPGEGVFVVVEVEGEGGEEELPRPVLLGGGGGRAEILGFPGRI